MRRIPRNRSVSSQRQRAQLIALVVSCSAMPVASHDAAAQENGAHSLPRTTNGRFVEVSAAVRSGIYGERVDSERISSGEGLSHAAAPRRPQTPRIRRLPSVATQEAESVQVPETSCSVPEESELASQVESEGSFDDESLFKSVSFPQSLPTTDQSEVPSLPRSGSDGLSAIAVAAQRNALVRSQRSEPLAPVAGRWLQSITTSSCSERASKLLDDAYREYAVSAWSSAEDSAWKSLELIVRGIDVADRQTAASNATPSASISLEEARTAIREARDFVAGGGAMDAERLEGIVSSHQTPVLTGLIPKGITASEAADRYLDHARIKLAEIAGYRIQAAQAMDLIAAIGLGRNNPKCLPAETALCLRRAALQGQPSNVSLASRLGMQLADMGLDNEAAWTLQHVASLEPNGEIAKTLARVKTRAGERNSAMQLTAELRRSMPKSSDADRVPDVVELTPSQFASISPAINVGPTFPTTQPVSQPVSQPEFQQTGAPDNARPGSTLAQRNVAASPMNANPQIAESTAAAFPDTKPNPPRKRRSFIPASLASFRMTPMPPEQAPDATAMIYGDQSAIVQDAFSAANQRAAQQQRTTSPQQTGNQQATAPFVPAGQPVGSNRTYRQPPVATTSHSLLPSGPPSAVKRFMGKLPRLW